jgi:hypothetical protein
MRRVHRGERLPHLLRKLILELADPHRVREGRLALASRDAEGRDAFPAIVCRTLLLLLLVPRRVEQAGQCAQISALVSAVAVFFGVRAIVVKGKGREKCMLFMVVSRRSSKRRRWF